MKNVGFEGFRVAGLWVALALFFTRVVAQIEVVLLQPDWLPPMPAWYSGLIPYPALLPAQIVLLVLMGLAAYDHTRGSGIFWPKRQGTRRALAWIAALYAAAMAVRLMVSAAITDGGLIEAGIIPVAFHWVLASFLALISAAPDRLAVRSALARPQAVAPYEKPVPKLPFLSDIASASEFGSNASKTASGGLRTREDQLIPQAQQSRGYSEVPLDDLVRIRRRSL